MKTVHFAFTLLALSMVAAFPLIGESFAQVDADPTIISANVTGSNQLTIVFSEKVTVPKVAFGDFRITDGTFADGTAYNAPDADFDIDIVRDVSSARQTADNKIWNIHLKPVRGQDLGTDVKGTIDINTNTEGAKIRDDLGNELALSAGQVVGDGQSPQIKSVKIIDNLIVDPFSPQVQIVYTEPVVAGVDNYIFDGKNVTHVNGLPTVGTLATTASTDVNTIGKAVPSSIPEGAETHTLTLSGNKLPADATGLVNFIISKFTASDREIPNGPVDAGGNVLKATRDHPLTDHLAEAGQIPTVLYAKFIDDADDNPNTDLNLLQIKFSEELATDAVTYDSFVNITLDDGTIRNPMVGTSITNVDDPSVYTLRFGGDVIPTGATGTMTIDPLFNDDDKPVATLKDGAGNEVKAIPKFVIDDGQKPVIESSKITGPNELTIKFSEPVRAELDNFGDFYVGDNVTEDGDKRTLSNLRITDDTITFRISGNPISTDSDGVLAATVDVGDSNYAYAGITDLAKSPNVIIQPSADTTHPVMHGQNPTIKSAKITSPNMVEIIFSEDIQTDGSSQDVSSTFVKFYTRTGNMPLTATSIQIYDADAPSATGSKIILIFPNTPFDPTDTGRVTITDDIVSQETGLKFEGVEKYIVKAGQIPTVESAKITAPNEITITFSEPVQAKSDNFDKFTLTGGTDITVGETRNFEEKTLTPPARADLSSGDDDDPTAPNHTKFTLEIAGDPLPPDATGTVNIKHTVDDSGAMDSLIDSDGIQVRTSNKYPVTDGQNPNLESAKITTPNQVSIKFSESVISVHSDFKELRVEGASRNITGFTDDNAGNGSDTIKLTMGGKPVAKDARGIVNIAASEFDEDTDPRTQLSLIDLAGNPLVLTDDQLGAVGEEGAVPYDENTPRIATEHGFNEWPITAGQIPSIMSAKITGPNEITIMFTIPVNATLSAFTNFTLDDESTARSLTEIVGSGTDTIILTVSGTGMLAEAQGTIDVAGTIVGTISGVAFVADSDVSVVAGQPPNISSAKITAPDTVTVFFTESVDHSSANFEFTVDGEVEARAIGNVTSTSTVGAVAIVVDIGDDDKMAMPSDAIGKISITGIKNSNTEVPLKPVSNFDVDDGQAPMISSARVTDNNTVTIKFSERVNTILNDFDNFMLTTGEGITANEPRELSRIVHPDTSDTVILHVQGATLPVDAEGTINIKGSVSDLSRNNLVALTSYPVSAGQLPEVVSAVFTGPNVVSITFSEPVMVPSGVSLTDSFTDFKVSSDTDDLDDVPRNVTKTNGNGTSIITVIVGGTFNIDTTATIDIADNIVDLATPPNSLAESYDDYDVGADERPKIISSEITGPNEITIKFSENVISSQNDYVGLMVTYTPDGADQITKPINIADMTGSGSSTAILTVNKTLPEDATGTITLIASKSDTDASGNKTFKSMVDNRGQLIEGMDEANNPPTRSVQLSDGQQDMTTATFGPVKGMVFSDDNGNGIKDIGESGISTLIMVAPELARNDYRSGILGDFTLQNVADGTYVISVQIPTDYDASDSTKNVTVSGGQSDPVNFALKPLVTVSGTVFNDANGNGSPDSGEGISGATVSITDDLTDMTDANGMYEIMNVPAGSYQATVTQSGYATITMTVNAMGGATADNTANFALGSVGTVMGTITNSANNEGIPNIMVSITDDLTDMTDANGMYEIMNVPAGSQTVTIMAPENSAGDTSQPVTVTRGGSHTVDFALMPVGTVMGTVYNDMNNNGMMDEGESGISGIMVSISETLTATTDADGMYEIMNVPTGTHDVMLDVSDGYLGSTSMQVTVSQGMSATVDFALTPVGMISGMVFSDTNANEIKDSSETGLAGITVSITGTELTAMTGNDGMYTIINVPVGDYMITVTAPDTHFAEMTSMSVTVTQGDTAEANFALEPKRESNTATISGTVFDDLNGNGTQDDGEDGFGVYSMMAVTNMTTGDVQNTNTDENGMYSFTVRAGDPHLIQTTFFPTGITVSDPNSSWFMRNVTVEAGMDYDFDVGFHTVVEGEFTTLDLTIFLDANRNGMMDEGESGISGVRLNTYTYTIGAEDIITNAEGKVLKTDLVPADWAVQWGHYGVPAGYGVTGLNYERSDSTVDKMYASDTLVVDDPEKNSTHTMTIGLVPTS